MKYAVIDIGSNSMRLTAYETQKDKFTILFKDKIMAGLANYVENGRLTSDGILRAITGLLQFRRLLSSLAIERTAVFATASLRNIENTQEAVSAISEATGFPVEVLSGHEEARLGFYGATLEFPLKHGIFLDIGGASTETARFEDGTLLSTDSFPVGSLKLYRECVKKILPSKKSLFLMTEVVSDALSAITPPKDPTPLLCVGGTARAALRLVRRKDGLPQQQRTISAQALSDLYDMLAAGDRPAIDLILKTTPERIHTILPGLVILRRLSQIFQAESITISHYGVREGYVCQRIQKIM
ncbi:MAG TPA: hypothetical protein H9687_04120 [Firmicutes bacterium]|nr:hypothetical protein [Bacillota bacterium]